jgi:alpha-tubulin suppressor-like RCC1 family protein
MIMIMMCNSVHGQVGVGHRRDVMIPTLITSLSNERITQAACGGAHTLALTASQIVLSWGLNQSGLVHTQHTTHYALPRQRPLG